MTTQYISRFCGLLASTLLMVNSFAQISEFKNLQPALLNNNHVRVYQNILDEFHKQFAGAENIKWSKLDKNFVANFTLTDQPHTALFNPQAMLIYKISYGKEKHLPVAIRKSVKRMYVEFVISAAIKVEEADRTIWVIYIEDDETLVSLRVEDNEMEETQKYAKFKPKSSQINLVKQ